MWETVVHPVVHQPSRLTGTNTTSFAMDESSYLWRVLLLIWLCLECLLSVHGQSTCHSSRDTQVIVTDTTSPPVLMTCTVPTHLVLDAITMDTWLWDKLAADDTIDQILANINSTSPESSTYQLSVDCSSGGFYEALYRNASGACLYRCLYFLEVEEKRPDVILDVFSVYPAVFLPISIGNGTLIESNDTQGTTFVRGQAGRQVIVGRCGTMFYSGFSGCVIRVVGRWFKDRRPLDVHGDPRYVITISGELRIRNHSVATAGDYVCVTSPSLAIGYYVTLAVGVSLDPASTNSPPPTTMNTPPSATDSQLRDWEIGLIAANAAFVVLLVGVAVCCLVGCRRKSRPRAARDPVARTARPRPESMIEHIQLLEEAPTEEVDCMSTSPVEVPFSSILFEELLHKGTFKVVHHAVVNYPALGIMSQPVAVKRLKDDRSELGMEELMGEVYTLKAFQNKAGSHPNVVQLVGVTTQGGPTCLLLEYIPHGRLDDFLFSLKDGPLPEWYVRFVKETISGAYHKWVSGDLMRVLLQVAEGMNFLTDHGFIHRDLSTRTVLIGERMNVKIADTGMTHEGYYYVVTEREHFLQDMAPECLWEKRFSVWSDVWSFGILAYKVITLETVPFPDATVSDLYDKMVGGERPQLLASFSNEMYFLLQRCWQFIATERPTFASIVSDLKDMAEKSTKHIIFKVAKEPQTGYISETGQVFLHPLPSYALNEPSKTTKKKWRSSGTQLSIASSIDDTVYTRETTETVMDFTQSENEDVDNYESYLRGDLPTWDKDESSSLSGGEELNTPQLRQTKGTRVWVESAGSKVYIDTPPASDEGSKSGVAVKKKKKKKSAKKESGFVNPLAISSTRSPVRSEGGDGGGVGVNTNTNNNVGVGLRGEESESSINPPSVTEDETGRVAKRLTSDQLNSRHSDPSSEEIVEL